jgi:hypothetical protein
MSWLKDLKGIREIFRDGTAVAIRSALNFSGDAWHVQDNESTGRTDVTFSLAEATDPTTGFTVRLLPQIDTSISSTDATPITVATVALDANHIYEFGVYVQAFGTASTTYLFQKFSAIFERHVGDAAEVAVMTMLDSRSANIASILGLELVASGNDVLVRWTGHGTVALRPRTQVGYVKRAAVLA